MEYWLHNNSEVSSSIQLPQGTIGFVYSITNTEDNRLYIGKKFITKGWENYYGSSEDLKADIKRLGKSSFVRRILKPCDTKIRLTYWEVAYQIKHEVLLNDSYNRQILGKFWKGRI